MMLEISPGFAHTVKAKWAAERTDPQEDLTGIEILVQGLGGPSVDVWAPISRIWEGNGYVNFSLRYTPGWISLEPGTSIDMRRRDV